MTPAISTSGRGRPRAFDRNEALKAALRVFWQRGYAPASVAELCKAMGINAPSLYAAFGSKAGLFLEALHFYEDSYWDEPAQRLLAEPNLFRALVNFFTEAAHILLGPDSPCGCMVVLAAINVGDDAAPVMDEVHKLRLATCNLFAERLRRAVQDGQLAADCDIDALADALNVYLEGLSLHARDGLSGAELERIARLAVRFLPGWEGAEP